MPIITKLRLFGCYPHHYIRASLIDKLIKCPAARVMSMEADLEQSPGGPAAQLGSLVHKAIEAYHLIDPSGKNVDLMQTEGVKALRSFEATFPLADKEEATKIFTYYANDPRNWRRVDKVEIKVQLELPPHPTDPTKQPITIIGHIDQITYINGHYCINDIKTGDKSGQELMYEHMGQQSAYFLAAHNAGFPVKRAFIARTKGYRVRGVAQKMPSPDGVFWCMPIDKEFALDTLDRLRLEVANIRRGEVNFTTSVSCIFCEHQGPANCRPKLINLLNS